MAIRELAIESAEKAIERLHEPRRAVAARILAINGAHAERPILISVVRRRTSSRRCRRAACACPGRPAGERQEQLVLHSAPQRARWVHRTYVDDRGRGLGSPLGVSSLNWPTPYAADILGRLAGRTPGDSDATSR